MFQFNERRDLSNTSVGIELWETEDSKVLNNTASDNTEGIHLYLSSNNIIRGNNASNNNGDGISLTLSSNNIIRGNNASNNNDDGISLEYSSKNKIYFNNLINNTNNVYSYDSTNIWNSPSEITYIYGGTSYTNCLGNYWNDYEGTDADADGIGDTPYSIDSKKDESADYPLMKPFENYSISTSAHT
jgi:parallel beta-helix repeat protein